MDEIQHLIGGFGKYQFYLCAMVFITKFFIAFNQMAIIFLAPKVSFKCNGVPNHCPCPNPEYDKSVFTNTIVMKWNLICERKMLVSTTQTMFQLGTLTGSVLFGMASDRFGRRLPLLFAVLWQMILGISVAFVPSFWIFTFMRYLIGMTVGGTMVIGFVIIMEFVGSQHRELLSAAYQIPFNLGHMLLPVISYFFRDYSDFLLGISLPSLLMLSYFVYLPETPRWFIAMKKTDEAIKIIERVSKTNKKEASDIRGTVTAFQAALEAKNLKKGSILDLFRTPNLRKNIICISLDWLSCSYCFYGVSQFVGQLSGNIFLNVLASAFVTVCGTLCSILMMKVFGRKLIIIANCYITATCLILLALLPDSIVSVFLATIGMLCALLVFIMVYLYTAELFPTVVRNAALGFSSMIARVGSMVAPFVLDLGAISTILPPLAFAVVPLISGTTTFLLPETKGCPLMTTIEEAEEFGKKAPIRSQSLYDFAIPPPSTHELITKTQTSSRTREPTNNTQTSSQTDEPTNNTQTSPRTHEPSNNSGRKT